MGLKFWTGPSGSGKTYKLYNFIIEESIKNPELTYIMVVPEQFNLQAQQDIVRLHPRHGMLNIDVVSFSRLAHRIFEETGYGSDGGKLIDDMGKNLIIRNIALRNKDKLSILGANLNKLGYITQVKSAISEFMQYGITTQKAEDMVSEAEKSGKGQLSLKLKDISFLYSEFMNEIKDKYTTREELMMRLSRVLDDSEKIKKCVIVLDGFTGFTPVQLNVIEKLLIYSRDVHISVTIDRRNNSSDDVVIREHELFYLGKKTMSQVGKIADRNHINIYDDENIIDDTPARFISSNGQMIPHLEKFIFRDIQEEYIGSYNDNDEIHIRCGLTPDEEMELNALSIMNLIVKKGYKYSDIAIITGDIEKYRDPIERSLERYRIPYFTDKTSAILLNPMIEYLRAAIKVLSDNYSYESIFRLLRSGLTVMSRESIDELENYCISTGVKGRAAWNKLFSRLPATYKNRESEEKAEFLTKINNYRVTVCNLINSLEKDIDDNYSNRGKYSVKTFSTAFYNLFDKENIGRKLSERSKQFEEAGKASEARIYEQIYERTMGVFEQLSDLLGDEKLYIKEFGQLVDAGLDEIRIGIIPKNTDYVQIGDLTRSRLRDVKALFVVGVNDGIVPQSVPSTGIISDADKQFFMESYDDIEFAPTARENAYTQRLYIYMMLTKPKEYLSISYSKINSEGESHRPSYLIKTIQGLFPKLKTEYLSENINNRISDKNATYKALIKKISEYITDDIKTKNEEETFEYLLGLYSQDDNYGDRIEELITTGMEEAGISSNNGALGSAVAALLYGKNLYSSVTRLETYAKCAYEYYLKYGLKLNERETYDFAVNDLGTVFHASLERYMKSLRNKNTNIAEVDDDLSKTLIEEAVEYSVAAEEMAAIYSTKRTSYMVKRIKRIMKKTVEVLKYQAGKGMFKPYGVEFDFRIADSLDALNFKLSDDESLKMSGRIDRIDTHTEGDNTYVRIIDYKTGDKKLDLAAVYEGRELQLVVYLDAAMEMIKNKFNKNAVPAGILYYHMDDPLIKSDTITDIKEIEDKVKKTLKMKGYVNSDKHIIHLMDDTCEGVRSDIIPAGFKKDGELYADSKTLSTDEFNNLIVQTREKISELGREILDGHISTAIEMEYLEKYPKTCDYCDYKSICHQRTGFKLTDGSSEESENNGEEGDE